MCIAQQAKSLRSSRQSASVRTFNPTATIKCDGPAVFRSQTARDAACLFDVNPSVTSWHCMPMSLDYGDGVHVPDFGVLNEDGGRLLVDASDRIMPVDSKKDGSCRQNPWHQISASCCRGNLRRRASTEFQGPPEIWRFRVGTWRPPEITGSLGRKREPHRRRMLDHFYRNKTGRRVGANDPARFCRGRSGYGADRPGDIGEKDKGLTAFRRRHLHPSYEAFHVLRYPVRQS